MVLNIKARHSGFPYTLVSISARQNLANEITHFYEETASGARTSATLDTMYLFLYEQTKDLDKVFSD